MTSPFVIREYPVYVKARNHPISVWPVACCLQVQNDILEIIYYDENHIHGQKVTV